jgi:PAS domain-containing protein
MLLSTCAVILVLACAGLFVLQLYLFKETFSRDLQALAAVIAANSAGPVSFGDKKAAEEVLSTLQYRPQVVAASIRLPDGTVWIRTGATEVNAASPSADRSKWHFFRSRDRRVSQPIRNGGETLGILELSANFDTTYRDLLRYYGTILVGVLIGCFIVAFLLSARLQRFIADPIQQLAGVVHLIAVDKNYSVRAQASGRDEIGQLTEAFNYMLSQIQARDSALEESRKRFEVAVLGSSDGLWDWDLEAQRIYFSPRWKGMLGYRDEDLPNRFQEWEQRLHAEFREVRAATGAPSDAVAVRAGSASGELSLDPAKSDALRLDPGPGLLYYDSFLYVMVLRSKPARGQRDDASRDPFVSFKLDVVKRGKDKTNP